ncbi:hypothetical protein J5N97_012651 [Dioscorea zingiberensis]|uniref:Uncharacterized protein n=1 Tax=Dioscorea zingiberensis TaxID=325984 RepID=A0A9D5HIA9_9LILI|nr:hypothetical protein J5N97_012651 [Dioscorea zingiberensis]
MAIHGLVDWKDNPINKQKHGGVKAAGFIYFLVVMLNMAYVPNILTLVTYLHDTMHTGVASSSTIVTNFIGVTCAFALLGAFLSDSYITRFTTILIFGPFEFLMIILVIYDRLFVPFARKITGYSSGIMSLQRIGIGFFFMPISTCIAALIEMKRKHIVEENGDPISVFWLSVQFFILGINDVTNFVGLLEFCNGEVSRGMKSIGTAIFWCVIGLPSLIGSFLVGIVNTVSRNGDEEGTRWLEGNTLNESQLDKFYWLLSVIGFIAFLNYLFWARKYVYRHNPRISVS